jgi:hypothetical protein
MKYQEAQKIDNQIDQMSKTPLSVIMSATNLRAMIQRVSEFQTPSCRGIDIGGIERRLATGVGHTSR